MKSTSFFIIAIASIMSLSTVDAHPLASQKSASINTCRHHYRGKMARTRAHTMRHHIAGRLLMRKMRSPRIGISIVL